MDVTLRRLVIRRAIQLVVEFAAFGVILFVAAGTVRWWNAWAFLGSSLVVLVATAGYVLPRNPAIIAARGQRHQGTEPFDKVLLIAYTLPYLGILVVAGLDAGRFHWTPLPWPWSPVGAALLAVSMIPVAGAMAVNPFLETTVRIQTDRGHRVVADGPYQVVRHPMYVGMLVQLPATVLLLGSAWAFLPALFCAGIVITRTSLEDSTLRQNLPGYEMYAALTRYRIVPGLW